MNQPARSTTFIVSECTRSKTYRKTVENKNKDAADNVSPNKTLIDWKTNEAAVIRAALIIIQIKLKASIRKEASWYTLYLHAISVS